MLSVLLSASATPALAHSGTGLAGGFAAGFGHPFGGFDHMLAMVAVGLWGAFLGRPLIAALPMVFPGMMAVGGAMGIAGVPLPPVEIGIAVSVLVLGLLIAGAVRLGVVPACLIVAGFAVFHGYAHGLELPSAADPLGYSLGFVVATGLLHLGGIALGLVAGSPRGALVVRGLGGAIAVMGGVFIAAAFGLAGTLA